MKRSEITFIYKKIAISTLVPLFRSIEVEGVKEVYVINNEFNINVIKVQQSPDT